MTRREKHALIHKLQELRGLWQEGRPNNQALSRSRARVMAHILAQGAKPAHPLTFVERFKVGLPQLVMPKFITGFGYAIAVFALFLAGGALAVVSERSLPGDTLYGTKLSIEKAQVHLTANTADRAKVQMEFAGRRLEEAKTVAPEHSVEAIERFSQDVKVAQKTLQQAENRAQAKAVAGAIAQKVEDYQRELAQAKVRPGRKVEVSAIVEAEKTLKAVQEEVTKVANEPDLEADPEAVAQPAPENTTAPVPQVQGDKAEGELQDGEVGL